MKSNLSVGKWKKSKIPHPWLIAQKPEVHPKIFNGKTLFRDLTPQILNFVLVNQLIKCFQYCVKLRFLFFFVLFKAEKTVSKLTLHHMGKIFDIRFGKIRFGIWRVTFLKSFFLYLPLENFGMGLRFLCSGRFTTCALR